MAMCGYLTVLAETEVNNRSKFLGTKNVSIWQA